MVTQPAPVDEPLTVFREATIRQLAEDTARRLRGLESARADELAYAGLLAENVERVQHRTCAIILHAINPSEQERILAVAEPWLRELKDRLDGSARTSETEDGTSETVLTEWPFSDEELTVLTRRADGIVAETEYIADSRRTQIPAKAPPILYEDKLEDLRDKLMPERCLGPWIKFGGIRQWLDHCDSQHTSHCHLSDKSKEIFSHHPRWLVDVENRCLVEAKPGQRYLALSYVWGTHASFQTLKSNLDALQKRASLVPTEDDPSSTPGNDARANPKVADIEHIARTVADAIDFVDRLEEKYLWVDALCIVQDDEADKQEHLAHMGSIYANAYATIVVTNGAASVGLRGIQDATPPMQRRRGGAPYTPVYMRRPETMASTVGRHMMSMQQSQWNKRAWTFQEQIFSRRLIILGDAEVTWECHCSVWLEGVAATASQCARNTAVVAEGFSFHMDPQFGDYAHHAAQYNARQLSFPEDGMDAFAGILAVLRTAFPGGFLCCLPVMFFDTALLWYNDGMVEERHPRKRKKFEGLAPSWSWAAFGGRIAFPDFSAAREGVRPLVRWKYCSGDEQKWMPVRSLEKQEPGKKLPTAEELAERVGDLSLEDEGPTPAGEPMLPAGTGIFYHHVLHSRPERALFKVLEYYGDEGVPLAGASGECVGVLTPCRKLGSQTVDAKTTIECELVAVSESFISGVETYNVLWIEKKEGIEKKLDVHVRKGVGRILKSDWIAQKPKRIDLLLV